MVKPRMAEMAGVMRVFFFIKWRVCQAWRMAVMAAAMSFFPKVVEPATMTFAPAAAAMAAVSALMPPSTWMW